MKEHYYDKRVSAKLQVQIKKFSQRVTRGFKKPERKWVGEMLYGILKSKDVKLTHIGRALKEKTKMKHTEKRLSRNISGKDISNELIDAYLLTGKRPVGDETILSLDLSDISKKEAKRMENLCGVWNGSEGRNSKGYWLCTVVAKNLSAISGSASGGEEEEVIPLYNELYSSLADEFKSESTQIFKAIDKLTKHFGNKGIWVMDRGGDSGRIIQKFLDSQKRFIIRLVAEGRHLETKEKKGYPIEMAEGMKLKYKGEFQRKEEQRTKVYKIRFGYKRVRLPRREEELTLVVVTGFGKEPLMLLANIEIKTKCEALRVIYSYISRWVIEESFRFIKQSYNLEDIRLLRYKGLRNMAAMILLIYGFLSLNLLLSARLKFIIQYIYDKSKRLFGIADFPFYALADGIFYLLSLYTKKFYLFDPQKASARTFQLLLFNNLKMEV